ncbi:beta-lactamase family protein [Paenibacillus sp. N1-5-1-14]|uniref:serine hydrolase domain-containing protein n=1 Tax=Paenibacillus radicibacter TaxID=2972488 RepID=UPI0021593E93|nr:serine hydrolase domain-containing protein [Paenibacillus radicibacter]MCR8642508.1 beta-lactamase family protein [Paenibacillus radicibacter]
MKQMINIPERMAHYQVSALSIAQVSQGAIHLVTSYGELEAGEKQQVNAESIFNACSISKFVTSVLVMKLIELGKLDLDEDVNERLVSWKVQDNAYTTNYKVTLRTLLSHQGGFIDPEGSFDILQLSHGIPKITDLLNGKSSYCHEMIQVRYEPGSEFHYSDAGYCIIQQLIEDVCGKPFETVMQQFVFEPLHMTSSAYLLSVPDFIREHVACGHDKYGHIVSNKYPIYPYPATAGLWTTPTDLAQLIIAVMKSCNCNGNRESFLYPRLAQEMMTPQGCKEWAGLGLFLDHTEEESEISSLGWGVGFQCMLVAYPKRESAVILMTNTDLGVHQTKGLIGEVFSSLTLN